MLVELSAPPANGSCEVDLAQENSISAVIAVNGRNLEAATHDEPYNVGVDVRNLILTD